MIGHNNECIALYFWIMPGNIFPTGIRDFSIRIQAHVIIDDISAKALFVMSTNSDEIGSLPGIIITM